MKIERKVVEPAFVPVVITLESKDEVSNLKLFANCYIRNARFSGGLAQYEFANQIKNSLASLTI